VVGTGLVQVLGVLVQVPGIGIWWIGRYSLILAPYIGIGFWILDFDFIAFEQLQ
jgi:hypothetical protein